MSVTTDPTRVDGVRLGLVITALAMFVACDILGGPAVDLVVWILRTLLVELVEWLLE